MPWAQPSGARPGGVPGSPEYRCLHPGVGWVFRHGMRCRREGNIQCLLAALQQRGVPATPVCACAQRCRVVLIGLGRAMWFDSVHTAPADQQRYLEQVEAVLLLQAITHSSTAAAAAACCWGVWHNMHAVSALEHVMAQQPSVGATAPHHVIPTWVALHMSCCAAAGSACREE